MRGATNEVTGASTAVTLTANEDVEGPDRPASEEAQQSSAAVWLIEVWRLDDVELVRGDVVL